jgi:hypothetical protein
MDEGISSSNTMMRISKITTIQKPLKTNNPLQTHRPTPLQSLTARARGEMRPKEMRPKEMRPKETQKEVKRQKKTSKPKSSLRGKSVFKSLKLFLKDYQKNGYKMRMKVWADPAQSFRPTAMTAPTKTLAEILQTIPLEDAEQISEFQGLIYMPEQFMQKYLLPTMQIRTLLETENEVARGEQPLPGGPETAIMYSLYHQAKATQATTLDNKLRSLIAHSHTDTDKLVKDITENMTAKEKSLAYFTNQLREVTTLPTLQTICRMTVDDVREKNQLISSVLTNFEQQLKRDYKAYERERHQNVLIAKLNYEQQLC